MATKLVTAIIPTYNRAPMLARALHSIAEQTHRPLEAIVVDDGSDDGTIESIPGHVQTLASRDIELIFLRQAHGGPAAARNMAISRAQGSLICFLDSDDMWKPAFVATLAMLMDRYPGAGLAFGGYLYMDKQERVLGCRATRLAPQPVQGLLRRPFESIIQYMPFGTPCVMVRRAVLDQVGIFDTDFLIGEDWDLWFRISRAFDFAYTQEGLSCCRQHPRKMVKDNSRALADRAKLDLKYLPAVVSPPVRDCLRRRIRKEILLLREQLLREGLDIGDFRSLLEHELAPRTIRARSGAFMSRRPPWMGRSYAILIRTLGNLWRGVTG